MHRELKPRNPRYVLASHAVVAATILLALIVIPSSAVAQGLQWMHLVSPSVGWVASSTQIFWTSDNGQHWKDITPPLDGEVTSVFFLNDSMGWVLMSEYKEPQPWFHLAFTKDAGANWSTSRIDVPVSSEQIRLITQGSIQFTDARRGWLNLSLESSPAFHLGLLLRTLDGGKSWTWSEGPGTAGEVHFIDQRSGWILSPEQLDLWVTHDGAASWQRVVVAPPSQLSPNYRVLYDVPVFRDDKHGALTVTYSVAPPGDSDAGFKGSNVGLFTTVDQGKTWRFATLLGHLSLDASSNILIAVRDSDILSAQSEGDTLSLKRNPIGAVGSSITTKANIRSFVSLLSMGFVNDQQGWVMTALGVCSPAFLSCTRLLSTANGGSTWADITPGGKPKPPVPAGQPITLNWQPAGTLRPLSADDRSVHLGFHVCAYYDTNTMGKIWSGSAFQDAGIYIGGSSVSSGCNPPSTWINNAQTQGWGIMPTWSGRQAPCACWPARVGCTPYPHTFSSDPNQASTDGAQEADMAVARAQALGLSGGIIYYDLEDYNPGQCGAAATAFVDGWDTELQNTFGQLAGVYSAPEDASTWANIPGGNTPNDVWFAKADKRVTIWGMSYGVGDDLWPNDQRIHHFIAQKPLVIPGVKQQVIDRDIEDATIVASNVTKNPILTPFQRDYVACQTAWWGINNYNQLAGQFTGGDGPYSFQGLLDYYTPTGGDDPVLVPPAGLMTSLNNQCNYPECTYQSPLQNTAVGYQVPVPELLRGPLGIRFRRGQPAPNNTPSHNNSSCGPLDETCGVVVAQGQQPTTFNCSQALGSDLNGVSDDPQFVGAWWDDTSQYGFVSPDATGQSCYSFSPTGATYTYGGGVNGNGQVVGTFIDANQQAHGFIYNYGGGTNPPAPVPYDYPGATATSLYGINNNGLILGYADLESGGSTYFLLDENNATVTPISNPGNYTLNGLNDTSYIAGFTGNNYGQGCADGLLLESGLVP